MPGQGLVYMTLSKTWRARNCTTNNYGVSNITYGLSPAPCRDCECLPACRACLICVSVSHLHTYKH